jgi:hypothetical protein
MATYTHTFQGSALALSLLMAGPALANDVLADLLATLSNAKAQVEGRASRAQSCAPLRGSRMLEDLLTKYEDARNPFNGRLDAWVFVLRNRRSVPVENALEPEKMAAALAKVRYFTESADQSIRKAGCQTKVLWKEIGSAVIAFGPLVAEGISHLLKRSYVDDKEREELLKALEQRKIKAWDGVTAYFVYDWSTEEFLTGDKITDAALRKGSTSVYVNKWALKSNPGPLFVMEKLPPEGFDNSYLFYTGKIKDLERYTGATGAASSPR